MADSLTLIYAPWTVDVLPSFWVLCRVDFRKLSLRRHLLRHSRIGGAPCRLLSARDVRGAVKRMHFRMDQLHTASPQSPQRFIFVRLSLGLHLTSRGRHIGNSLDATDLPKQMAVIGNTEEAITQLIYDLKEVFTGVWSNRHGPDPAVQQSFIRMIDLVDKKVKALYDQRGAAKQLRGDKPRVTQCCTVEVLLLDNLSTVYTLVTACPHQLASQTVKDVVSSGSRD